MNARRRSTVQLRSRVAKAVAFAAVAGILLSPGAIAGGHKLAAATNAAWKSECGSCHVAYPPGLLPAASWRAIMAGLDRVPDPEIPVVSIRELGILRVEQHLDGQYCRAGREYQVRLDVSDVD